MAIVRTGVSSAMTSSTATVSIPLPTGCAAGDVGVLCIETANEGLGTNPGALGWTVLTGSTATATGTAAAAGATRLAVLWKVLTSGDITTGSVSISDSGDHQNAVMATYSGVDATTPITWNSGLGDVGATATTSVVLSSVTRASASTVTLGIIATDRDNATASTNTAASWTGAGAPASNSFIANFSSITGQGGGLILNEGTGGAAGAAAFSCSITSSIWVGRVIVLNPAAQTLTPSLFTNSQTFFDSPVSTDYGMTPSLFTNSQTFFSATVSQAGVQNLTPSLFTNTQTFYTPVLTTTVGLTPSLFTNSQTFFTPVLSTTVGLTPSLFTNSQTFFTPVLLATKTLTPSLFTNSQTFYSATITTTYSLVPSLFSNSQTFYSPTVSLAGAPTTLLPSLVINTQAFFGPTVSLVGTTITIFPTVCGNVTSFYSPALTNVTRQPTRRRKSDLEFTLGRPFFL